MKRELDATGPVFVCLLLNGENLECGSMATVGAADKFWSLDRRMKMQDCTRPPLGKFC